MQLPHYALFKGKIVPFSEAKVSVLTHALHYGTAVFGGLRGYWNREQEQLYVFRPHDHFHRFIDSGKLINIDLGETPDSLTNLAVELLQVEGYQCDVYIRPLAYKADEVIGVKVHGLTDALTMVAFPFEKYILNDTNAHVGISSWRRVDDNAIPARGKISGAYANSSLIKTDATLSGFDEALVLTQDGHISEGSAMNVFMLRNGVLVTPPVTENILEGITRRTVMELAQTELGIQVVERPIDRTEVYLCEEFFMTGTAAEITAVTRVDHRWIGEGKMGPTTTELRSIFSDIVHGRNPKYSHWIQPVFVKSPAELR